MKKLVLIGSGGYCTGVLDSLRGHPEYDIVGITDPRIAPGTLVGGIPVLGNDDILPGLFLSGVTCAHVTVGSVKKCDLRRKLVAMANDIGFDLISILDPTAVIAESAKLGKMIYVGKNAIINAGTVVGDYCIINTGSIVEHGCKIGNFVHIAPGAVLAGDIYVGDYTHVGMNASVLQGLHIGTDAVIGAGTTVLRDVADSETAVGIVKRSH